MISISESLLREIREHGVRDYPYECCGLLLGRYEADGKVVNETYPISNAREESAKRNRFLIQPEELLRGEQYARSRQLEVVGFYHSHPDSPAVPSRYDLEHAWPTYSYIIVSTSEGHAGDLYSWEQEADRSRFNQEELKVTTI
jgi:proteasome lid subunit RPN8/RPN11